VVASVIAVAALGRRARGRYAFLAASATMPPAAVPRRAGQLRRAGGYASRRARTSSSTSRSLLENLRSTSEPAV